MPAESVLSKRQVTTKKITLALFLLLELFSSHIYCVQNALFVLPIFYQAPQETCDTLAGRNLLKNRNPSRAAQFLDVGRIWPAGRSLHTPDLCNKGSCRSVYFLSALQVYRDLLAYPLMRQPFTYLSVFEGFVKISG